LYIYPLFEESLLGRLGSQYVPPNIDFDPWRRVFCFFHGSIIVLSIPSSSSNRLLGRKDLHKI
jgi:hypothetical protein